MLTNFAKIEDGVITEYPVSDATYKAVVEATAPEMVDEAVLLASGFVKVTVPPYKMIGGYDYNLSTPLLIDGVWVAQWQKDKDTPEDRRALRFTNASANMRRTRDALIKAVEWRYQRYDRHERLGLPQVDSLSALDTYVQALADATTQPEFPFDVQWPTL